MQLSDNGKYLCELLSFAAGVRAPEDAEKIIKTFVSPADVASTSSEIVQTLSGCSEQTADFLSLVAAISSRRVTDDYKPGRKYSTAEIKKYVCALLFHLNVESVYMISFDRSGKFIGSDLITEGTVNTSAFLPRKIVDIALRRKAASVVLAHNHPSGNPLPSENDVTVTLMAESVLRDAHVKLNAHYINVGFSIYDCLEDAKIMSKQAENVAKIDPT